MSAPQNSSGNITVTAFQIGEAISIRECRAARLGRLVAASSQELFYGPAASVGGGHTSVLSCGVVVHAGRTESEMTALNERLRIHCRDPLSTARREESHLMPGGEPAFGPDTICVRPDNPRALRIVMLHLGRSLALDYYEEVAKALLHDPEAFIKELVRSGRLKPSRKTVLRYIGRTMEARSRVIDTLHAFEVPEPAWDDDYLDRLDRGMNRAFDIEIRFKSIRDQLDVAKENLDILSGLLQHRESTRLEWVIIILIFIEVVRVFFK